MSTVLETLPVFEVPAPNNYRRARVGHVIQRPGESVATLPPPYRVSVLGGWPLKLSSSEIRARVKGGKAVDGLVPPGVAQVIAEERLYLPA